MGPTDAGIRCSFGVSGSGKSFGQTLAVHDSVRAGVPVIVIDIPREWKTVPPELRHVTRAAPDVATAAQLIDSGARLVIVRPAKPRDAAKLADDACEWACASDESVRGVVIAEAHNVAPNVSLAALPPWLGYVATAWRHARVALWVDTQRIATLAHALTDNARELRIYATIGTPDLKRLHEIGGRELIDAVHECTRRLQAYEEGKDPNGQGWYVRVGLSRLPPFVPQRDDARR